MNFKNGMHLSLRTAIQIAAAGILGSFIIEMAQYWYLSDQYTLYAQKGTMTLAQAILYERATYTGASLLRNLSLFYFFYVIQFKLEAFGEFNG